MCKICSKCRIEKSVDSFCKNKARKDGYNNYCKDCVKLYQALNEEKISEYRKEYLIINKNKLSESGKEYRLDNKEKVNAKNARRRSNKLNATPRWLTQDENAQILNFYKEAQILKLLMGEEYHVDHIVPLQGENVCGLHVPWNLQVIPASENISKSNKLLDDLLEI